MTTLRPMNRVKAKQKWDHEWIAAGLRAAGRPNVELAKLLNIHPGGVTRLLAGKRALKEPEATKIKEWLRSHGVDVSGTTKALTELLPITRQNTAVSQFEKDRGLTTACVVPVAASADRPPATALASGEPRLDRGS